MSLTLLRAGLLAGVSAILAAAQGQPETTQDSALQALLKEVRALRVAIEQSNRIAPRIQIVVARMQTQEERVRNASRRLQDVRDKLADTVSRRAKDAQNIKAIESQQSLVVDPNARKQFENDVAGFKSEDEALAAVEQQLRAQESEANAELTREQARLDEANDSLNALQRALSAQQN